LVICIKKVSMKFGQVKNGRNNMKKP